MNKMYLSLSAIAIPVSVAISVAQGHENATRGFTTVYTFCQQPGCADGANPVAGLIADSSGNLWGTTENGGAYGAGTVFKIAPNGTETVVYSFTGGTDGANPGAGLIMDKSGNMYGTTINGGTGQCDGPNTPPCGTVFKLTPAGVETVLYSFVGWEFSEEPGDGANPLGNLVMDGKGNLYGTTSWGGYDEGFWGGTGIVFKVTPGGSETVLYVFCTDRTDCTDGSMPQAGLILKSGYLYGTTKIHGNWGYEAYGDGTVFKLSTSGTNFTVLYTFCPGNVGRCSDGSTPEAPLVMDRGGNLYGTTFIGGAGDGHCYNAGGNNCGTVFEIPSGTIGTEEVMLSFCGANDYYCSVDGANPTAGLMAKTTKAGTILYGTTSAMGYGSNGENGGGAVFSLSKGVETVLHSFCSASNCADGANPDASMIMKNHYLYGTTEGGGNTTCYGGCGTVFKVGTLGGAAR